ncbi:hypothetical protein GCM10017562_12060 [Streptomyces roseofulvus]|uniref:hypothetical protein n=1 Tax=Streptomyces roseofulvus TaxID=33902 RepID=UPI0031F86FD1
MSGPATDHGVSAPNLDTGAVRDATILYAVTGREVYRLPRRSASTRFEALGTTAHGGA